METRTLISTVTYCLQNFFLSFDEAHSNPVVFFLFPWSCLFFLYFFFSFLLVYLTVRCLLPSKYLLLLLFVAQFLSFLWHFVFSWLFNSSILPFSLSFTASARVFLTSRENIKGIFCDRLGYEYIPQSNVLLEFSTWCWQR